MGDDGIGFGFVPVESYGDALALVKFLETRNRFGIIMDGGVQVYEPS